MRWSQISVSVIRSRATTRPRSSTAGFFISAPTARIAAWGGLTIAVKRSIPYMPRFETLNVPPDSSGGVISPSRTRSISRRAWREISPSDFWSASWTTGTTSASWAATATPTLIRE